MRTSERNLAQMLSNLDHYLDSWTDAKGGVHGYIIHHHRDYCVLSAPATWTQGVRMLGHLDLYEKTRDPRWLAKARRGGDYLVGCYVWEENIFPDSTTPLTLINNAWPTCALFRLARLCKEASLEAWNRYADVAWDCLSRRMIAKHWDPSCKTFYFCPPGFRSSRVHTYNQTAVAISALVECARATGDDSPVREFAIPAADHMIADQAPHEAGQLAGGWGYNDGESKNLYYYLYTALNLRGLLDLFEYTKDDRYLESAAAAGRHLERMIDPNTKLFSHRYVRRGKGWGSTRYTYPTMVAASALGLQQMRRLQRHGHKFDIATSIETLLSYQKPHGGFEGFIGSTDIWTPELFPCEPDKRKWRDVACSPFWNVFVFELLVDMLSPGEEIPPPNARFPVIEQTDDGFTFEEQLGFVRLSKDGQTVAFFDKRKDAMIFSMEPMRGVPFGAFSNADKAAIMRLRRLIKRAGIVAGSAILGEAALIAYLLLA